MVNSMLQIYETLDRKNADKVYEILSQESVEHFNFRLDPVSPPLSPSTSMSTSVAQTGNCQQGKSKKTTTNRKVSAPSQVPKTQNYVAPPIRSHHHGVKK